MAPAGDWSRETILGLIIPGEADAAKSVYEELTAAHTSYAQAGISVFLCAALRHNASRFRQVTLLSDTPPLPTEGNHSNLIASHLCNNGVIMAEKLDVPGVALITGAASRMSTLTDSSY